MASVNVMLDLETLDTTPTAVVTAVGAVLFDPHSKFIGPTFYRATSDWADQQKHGRTISGNTVAWWMEQSDSARMALVDPPANQRVSTVGMLHDFVDFLDGMHDVQIWGNGSDFDNVILGSLYQSYDIKRPWSYNRNRCFRTMKSLPRTKQYIEPIRSGTHHNALDDAITQAMVLQAIFADGGKKA